MGFLDKILEAAEKGNQNNKKNAGATTTTKPASTSKSTGKVTGAGALIGKTTTGNTTKQNGTKTTYDRAVDNFINGNKNKVKPTVKTGDEEKKTAGNPNSLFGKIKTVSLNSVGKKTQEPQQGQTGRKENIFDFDPNNKNIPDTYMQNKANGKRAGFLDLGWRYKEENAQSLNPITARDQMAWAEAYRNTGYYDNDPNAQLWQLSDQQRNKLHGAYSGKIGELNAQMSAGGVDSVNIPEGADEEGINTRLQKFLKDWREKGLVTTTDPSGKEIQYDPGTGLKEGGNQQGIAQDMFRYIYGEDAFLQEMDENGGGLSEGSLKQMTSLLGKVTGMSEDEEKNLKFQRDTYQALADELDRYGNMYGEYEGMMADAAQWAEENGAEAGYRSDIDTWESGYTGGIQIRPSDKAAEIYSMFQPGTQNYNRISSLAYGNDDMMDEAASAYDHALFYLPKEIDKYQKYMNAGRPDLAIAFHEGLKKTLDYRYQKWKTGIHTRWSDTDPLGTGAATVVTQKLTGLEGLKNAAGRALGADDWDTYGANQVTGFTQTVRQNIAGNAGKDIRDLTGSELAGKFATNAVNSIFSGIDSGTDYFIGKNVANKLVALGAIKPAAWKTAAEIGSLGTMFGEVYQNSFYNTLQETGDGDYAMVTGVVDGIQEVLGETLFGADIALSQGASPMKYAGAMLAGEEIEELTGALREPVVNTIKDNLYEYATTGQMSGKTQWDKDAIELAKANPQQYAGEGGRQQAYTDALVNKGIEMAWTAVGTAISVGPKAIGAGGQQYGEYAQTGKAIIENDQVKDFAKIVIENGDAETRERGQAILDKAEQGKKISKAEIGALFQTISSQNNDKISQVAGRVLEQNIRGFLKDTYTGKDGQARIDDRTMGSLAEIIRKGTMDGGSISQSDRQLLERYPAAMDLFNDLQAYEQGEQVDPMKRSGGMIGDFIKQQKQATQGFVDTARQLGEMAKTQAQKHIDSLREEYAKYQKMQQRAGDAVKTAGEKMSDGETAKNLVGRIWESAKARTAEARANGTLGAETGPKSEEEAKRKTVVFTDENGQETGGTLVRVETKVVDEEQKKGPRQGRPQGYVAQDADREGPATGTTAETAPEQKAGPRTDRPQNYVAQDADREGPVTGTTAEAAPEQKAGPRTDRPQNYVAQDADREGPAAETTTGTTAENAPEQKAGPREDRPRGYMAQDANREGPAAETAAETPAAEAAAPEQENAPKRKIVRQYVVRTVDGTEIRTDAVTAKAADASTAAAMTYIETSDMSDQEASDLLDVVTSEGVPIGDMEALLKDARNVMTRGWLGDKFPTEIGYSPEAARALYQKGQNQKITDEETRKGGRKTTLNPGNGKVTYRGVNVDTLDDETRKQVEAAAALAKRVGYNLIFENDTKNRNRYGEYDAATGSVIINLAGTDGHGRGHHLMVAMSHEVTHLLEHNSPEAYAQLRDFVFGEMARNGVDLINRIGQKMDNYNYQIRKMRENGQNLNEITIGGAAAEVVADACDQVFGNEKLIQKLANENPTLFEKVKNAVADFINKVKDAARGMRESGSLDSAAIRDVDKLAERWGIALDEARTGKTPAQNAGNAAESQQRQASYRNTINETYDEQFDKLNTKNSSAWNRYDTIVFLKKTPAVYVEAGMNADIPMTMQPSNFRKATRESASSTHSAHGIDINEFRNADESIGNPYFLLVQPSRNSVIAFTDITKNGKPVAIPFIKNKRYDTEVSNDAISAFELNNTVEYIENILKNDENAYIVTNENNVAQSLERANSISAVQGLVQRYYGMIAQNDEQGNRGIGQTQKSLTELNETALNEDLNESDGTETHYGEHRQFSMRVTDPEELDFLNGQETITTYKTMQLIDGNLYPPMAAVVAGNKEDHSVLGQWEKATEHPELIKKGNKFTLNKGKGQGSLDAAYNPYMHSSNLMINDQFSGAYARPNLVTVECVVPASENTSGYHAEFAKDSVGWHSWHTGTVAGQLRNQKGTERQVFLSRWIKPVRIVSDAEVAQHYADLLDGTDIEIPDNVVYPSLLEELKKKGVPIKETGKVKSSSQMSLADISEIQEKQQDLIRTRERVHEIENSKELQDAITKAMKEGNFDDYNEIITRTKLADLKRKVSRLEDEIQTWQKEYAEERNRKNLSKEQQAIAKSGLTEPEYRNRQAVKHFGTTTNPMEAGYIIRNGSMLNFSGEKGKHYGYRASDHREIGTIYEDDNIQGSAAMVTFMNDGNVRVMPESTGIDISNKTEPTAEQYRAIRKLVNAWAGEGEFAIDFSDEQGNNIDSIVYEGRISADKVIADIQHFYETGEVRQPSSLSRFFSFAEEGPAASDWIMAMDPNDIDMGTKAEKALVRNYQKTRREVDSIEARIAQMREQLKTAKGDEARKLRINLQTEQGKLKRARDMLNGLTSGKEFSYMLRRAQESISYLMGMKSQEDVNRAADRMRDKAEEMRRTAAEAAGMLEKIADREEAAVQRRYFNNDALRSAAAELGEYFGIKDTGRIEDGLVEIGLKMIAKDPGFAESLDKMSSRILEDMYGTAALMEGSQNKEVYGSQLSDITVQVLKATQKYVPGLKDANITSADRAEVRGLLDYVKQVGSMTRQAAAGMQRVAGMAQELKQQTEDTKAATAEIRRKLGTAIRYYDNLNKQADALASAERMERTIRQIESKAAQQVLEAQMKFAHTLENDRNVRRLANENLMARHRINTAYRRMAKLILDESDLKNVPANLQGVARAAIRMVLQNDANDMNRKLTGLDRQTLLRSRNTLELIDARDGKDLNLQGVTDFLGEDDVAVAIEEALRDIDEGVHFWNSGNGRTAVALEGDKAALARISKGLSQIYEIVTRSQQVFLDGKQTALSDAAYEVDAEARKRDVYQEYTGGLGKAVKGLHRTVWLGNMTPEYFFKNMKNNGISMLFNEFKNSEDRYGRIMNEAKTKVSAAAEKAGFGSWDMEQKHTIELESGRQIQLTLGEMMSIAATAKREATLGPEMSQHLEKGGIVLEQKKERKLYGREATEQKPIRLSMADTQSIINAMTTEQAQYVEDMVAILTKDMGKYGNEASRRMYGIDKYKETYYFPFQVWDGVKNKASNAGSSVNPTNNNRAAHQSFTNRRKNNAANALLIRDFNTVCAEHINQMATYATFGAAIENMNRVLNFRVLETGDENDENQGTVDAVERNIESILKERYGQNAVDYLRQFMLDLNGGAVQKNAGLGQSLMSMFKKNAVGGSLSVALQQPLSYIRASTMIDTKYLARALDPQYYKGSYNEMMAHSGVAVIKDMGKFDMNFARGAAEWLAPETLETSKARRVYNTIEDKTNALPEKMDQMTWTRMWSAVKIEQHAQHPEMDMQSDEFLDMVGKRFNDVMRRTQVYDSVLVKSQLMRSQGWFEKTITAFRAEPTISLNMFMDAWINRKEAGGKKNAAAVAATFLLGAIAQAAVKGIMGAGRNPDEKKTLAENFAYRFGSSFISEANPLGLIPGYDNIVDALSGNDINDNAWGMIKTFGKSLQAVWNPPTGENLNATSAYRYIEDTVGQITQMMSGVPAKNLMRDSRAVLNWFMGGYADREKTDKDGNIIPGRATNANVLKYQLIDQVTASDMLNLLNATTGLSVWGSKTSDYERRIYEAERDGKPEAAAAYREYLTLGKGVSEKTISSAVASAAKKDTSRGTAETAEFLLDNGYADKTSWITEQYKKGELTEDEVRGLYEKYFPDKVKNMAGTFWGMTKDQYNRGEISRAEAEKKYKEYYPNATADDIYTTFDALEYTKETGREASGAYYRLHDAIESNNTAAISKAADTLMQHGRKKNGFKSSIEQKWQDKYTAMRNGSPEKVKLRDGITKAMRAVGYSNKDIDKMFAKWEKGQKK